LPTENLTKIKNQQLHEDKIRFNRTGIVMIVTPLAQDPFLAGKARARDNSCQVGTRGD
jgi:hypothetical protein